MSGVGAIHVAPSGIVRRCDLADLGYPTACDIAQQALEAEGWTYLIQFDAWLSREALERYKLGGAVWPLEAH